MAEEITLEHIKQIIWQLESVLKRRKDYADAGIDIENLELFYSFRLREITAMYFAQK